MAVKNPQNLHFIIDKNTEVVLVRAVWLEAFFAYESDSIFAEVVVLDGAIVTGDGFVLESFLSRSFRSSTENDLFSLP
jgi:hypothetical protein